MKHLQAVRWLGGKGRMIRRLLPLLESIPHCRYVEPFGGGGVVLLNKKPVEVETYNDIDGGLFGFFKVIADPELFEAFKRRVDALPLSRELYRGSSRDWRDESDEVKRAVLWFVIARQSFGGRFGADWGMSITESTGSMSHSTSMWINGVKLLPKIHERLLRVQIENNDWRKVIDAHDTSDTLFYLDPPYFPDVRKSGHARYEHELSIDDHHELIDRLLDIQGRAAISGYANQVYDRLDVAGWKRIEWETYCSVAGRTRATGMKGHGSAYRMQSRTECLWIKPYESELTLF